MPSSKHCTVVAFPFSFMRFHECLQFSVFSQVLIMKQQHKKLWIVPELNAMRVLSFGLVVCFISKGKRNRRCALT